MPPQLSGFVCTFHPAAPGLSPKHTIYAFSIDIVQIVNLLLELECEVNENKQKEAGIGPIFFEKKTCNIFNYSLFSLTYLIKAFCQ